MRATLRIVGARTAPWPLLQRSAVQTPRAPLRSPSVAAASLYTRAMSEHDMNSIIISATRAQELLGLHRMHGQFYSGVNLATCWSRLGRVSAEDRTWLRTDDGAQLFALRAQTGDDVEKLGGRAVSNIAHALARLDLCGPQWMGLWKKLEGAALQCRSEFMPQELANMAWAFARAGHASDSLMDAIAEESAERLDDFKPQELANTAWAFATAGHAAPALFHAIGKESAGRVREFKPQELKDMAWAFATAGHAAPALFEAIGNEAAGRVREFHPQALANTAWAFSTTGYRAPALFDAFGKEAAGRVHEFSAQDLANTALAFAKAGHAAPALFDMIAKESAGRLGEFRSQGLTNMAWAFAKAGNPTPALFDAIGKESAGRVHEFSAQGLANSAWAFAVLDHLPAEPSFFDQHFAHRCDALADEFSVEALCQLHQWRLWYAGEPDGLPGAELLGSCKAAFDTTRPKSTPSTTESKYTPWRPAERR